MALFELPALILTHVEGLEASDSPVLINRLPPPDQTNVPIDTLVRLELVDLTGAGLDIASTQVLIDGQMAYNGGVFQAPFDGPGSAAATPDANTLRLTIERTTAWTSQATVGMRVFSQLLVGGIVLDTTYSFQIEDLTAPQLLSALAIDPRTVRLIFSESMHLIDQASLLITALEVPAVPLTVIQTVVAGAELLLTLNQPASPRKLYEIDVQAAVTDLASNTPHVDFDTAPWTGYHNPPPGRRFELLAFLPEHLLTRDAIGDYQGFVACLQDVVDLLLWEIDQVATLTDTVRCPPRYLDALLYQLGFPFAIDGLVLSTDTKRRVADTLIELHGQRGTKEGIENAIRLLLGLEITVHPLSDQVMRLGVSQLNNDWILGTSNRKALYSFEAHTAEALDTLTTRLIRDIIDLMRPAHTHYLGLRVVAPLAEWILGESLLGDTTVL